MGSNGFVAFSLVFNELCHSFFAQRIWEKELLVEHGHIPLRPFFLIRFLISSFVCDFCSLAIELVGITYWDGGSFMKFIVSSLTICSIVESEVFDCHFTRQSFI